MKISAIYTQLASQLSEIVDRLIDLNLCVRFPDELHYMGSHKIPLKLEDVQQFKANHKAELVISDRLDNVMNVTCCLVDGKELFKVAPVCSSSDFLGGLMQIEYEVISLDGKPVIYEYEQLNKAIKAVKLAEVSEMWKNDKLPSRLHNLNVPDEVYGMKNPEETLKENLTYLSTSFPWETQKTQLVEEIGELLQAVSKYERANGIGQPTTSTPLEARQNLIEEFAGVQVMMCEIMKSLGVEKEVRSEMLSQTNRTLSRVYKGKKPE